MRRFAKATFAGSTQGSGVRRGRIGLVCLCVLGLAAFLGSSAPSAGAQACPNETFRQGPSANLPDCRAYEMATPADMEGAEPGTLWGDASAGPLMAADESGVAWSAFGTFGESATSNSATNAFLSRRGASDWSTEQVSPPFSPTLNLAITVAEAFTENLDKTVSFDGGVEPPLTPDASAGTSNLYLRENATASFRLISVGLAENLGYTESHTEGISAGASHVVFNSPDELGGSNCAPPAKGPAGGFICDWNAATGTVSFIGISPETGEVLEDSTVAMAGPDWARTVSADGSRIFFKGGGAGGAGECGVCVRINGTSAQLISDEGAFWFASSDGSLAFVTEGEELFRYDVNADELGPSLAGEVQGVLGTSADGSRVYYVSDEGAADSLYMWSEGAGSQFIATGNGEAAFSNNYRTNKQPNSRVTPDGMHLAFTASNSLTGFPHAGIPEIYLYSAATDALVCASCNPGGEPEPGGSGGSIEVGAGTPGPDSESRLRRNLSDDGGRLFFNTEEALVPQDTNNLTDVYEYDAASGQVALITTGTAAEAGGGETNSVGFADASPSGDDVLFQTRQQLVGVDQDEALSIFDARVGGGLASQNPPAPAPPCTGDGCRGKTAPIPSQPSGASAAFTGKGNLSQKQDCNKLGREAKKLSQRAKRLRKNAKQAQRNGKSGIAKKRDKKAARLAKQARNKSKSAKKCRKANRGASK